MGHPVGIHNSPVEYLDSLVVVSLGRVQHGVGVDLGAGRPRVGLALVRELLGLLAVGEEAFAIRIKQACHRLRFRPHSRNRLFRPK